jgi:multidrug efflux system outer membrane protein
MIKKSVSLIVFFVFFTGLSGCAVMSPKYSRPASPIPKTWPTTSVDGAPLAKEVTWQNFFADPQLRKIIGLAIENNRDLKIAAYSIDKARAIYGVQKAEIFPVIGVASGVSSQRLPADVSPSGKEVTSEQYNVSFGVSAWELDFFGRVRSLKEQALESYLSTEQAKRAVQISLVSSVANAWIVLAADMDRLKLSQKTLDLQRETFNLIKNRHKTGIASELDMRQAEARMEAARVDTVTFLRSVALDRNLLDMLVGQGKIDGAIPSSLQTAGEFKKITAGLSSDVLLQRPDILQAENRLKAANASIGAARAAFFPRITLTTGIGTLSSEFTGLFKSGSGTWAFAPRIDIPIFDFGRRQANLDAALAESQIAAAQYEKAIQTAFRETADALSTLGGVNDQIDAQELLIKASQSTYRLASLRYQKGVDNYLPSLDAQRSLYGAQIGLIGLKLARSNAALSLYKALGGGVD